MSTSRRFRAVPLAFLILLPLAAHAGGVMVQEWQLSEVFDGRGFAAHVTVQSIDSEARTVTAAVDEVCAQPSSKVSIKAGSTETFEVHHPPSTDDAREWIQVSAYWDQVPINRLAPGSVVWLIPHPWGGLEIAKGDARTSRALRWFCRPDWEAAYGKETTDEQLAADLSDPDLREAAQRGLAARRQISVPAQ